MSLLSLFEKIPETSYLIASVLFILGLKRLSSPATARSGNFMAAFGMGTALVGALCMPGIENRALILLAIAIGTAPGWWLARTVKMTSMPQMVSLFNGMGGACAFFISISEFYHFADSSFLDRNTQIVNAIPILLGIIFGAVSFTGSIIAYGKLEGKISEKPLRWPLQKSINTILLAAMLVSCVLLAMKEPNLPFNAQASQAWIPFYIVCGVGLLLGILQVLPIGGADMPVVISVLNSCTGMAAAVTGFAMNNMAMIIAGTLVGAAGTLLTILMCNAMNRSLANVIFGSFGGGASASGGTAGADHSGKVQREISASEAAILMGYGRKVIVIPGYGLAVAQAQHLVHELEELLEKRNVEVKYAIHPVAGRMPGHMNVLLAEASVAYPKLIDMDEINAEFTQADVALVIGANDVVNPAAKTDPTSPIYGMPILNADQAKNVIVMKRGKGAGFAGIENELFFDTKTRMLFGDAKKTLQELVTEVKSL